MRTDAPIRHAYCDGPFGQVHLRTLGDAGSMPDLYCFHPAPFSGLAFTAIMPLLAQDRRVIAPDLPGHGGSAPHRGDASIGEYADAMIAAIESVSGGGPVDLLGFHTGCLVAAEVSLRAPDKVRRLVLCDAPAFEPDTRARLLPGTAAPPGFTTDLTSLSGAWERGIARRVESQGMARSWEMFVEQLRHGEAMNAGFHAAFTYDVETRLAQVAHPTAIVASQSGLLEATRRAATLIAGAELIERLDITRAVLDDAAATVATEVLGFLDRPAMPRHR